MNRKLFSRLFIFHFWYSYGELSSDQMLLHDILLLQRLKRLTHQVKAAKAIWIHTASRQQSFHKHRREPFLWQTLPILDSSLLSLAPWRGPWSVLLMCSRQSRQPFRSPGSLQNLPVYSPPSDNSARSKIFHLSIPLRIEDNPHGGVLHCNRTACITMETANGPWPGIEPWTHGTESCIFYPSINTHASIICRCYAGGTVLPQL